MADTPSPPRHRPRPTRSGDSCGSCATTTCSTAPGKRLSKGTLRYRWRPIAAGCRARGGGDIDLDASGTLARRYNASAVFPRGRRCPTGARSAAPRRRESREQEITQFQTVASNRCRPRYPHRPAEPLICRSPGGSGHGGNKARAQFPLYLCGLVVAAYTAGRARAGEMAHRRARSERG